MNKLVIFWRGKKRRKKYKITLIGSILLVLIGIVVSLVFAEMFVRFQVREPLEKEYLRFFCFGYKKILPVNYDKELLWKPVEEFKNVDYERKKPENTFRIICMGDSVTQGYEQGKGFLPREQTYVYKLEQLLAKKYIGKKIEVINAGNGGYSSLQGLRYLKKKLYKYEPDLVISWFGINDYFYSLFYSDKQQKIPNAQKDKSKKILQRSKLYLFVKNFFYIRNSLNNPVVRVLPEDFYGNCEQMLKFGDENDFGIVFIAPFQVSSRGNTVEYFEEYLEKLEALSNKYGVTVLYLKQYMDRHDLGKIYADTCHLNDEGNRIAASAIFELLIDQWGKYLAKVK